jgi:hypothetical protein
VPLNWTVGKNWSQTNNNKGYSMYKFTKIVLIVVLLTITFTACAVNQSPHRQPNMHSRIIDPNKSDYTILGPVRVERNFTGIIGFNTPMFWGINTGVFLFQTGGINYVDVLGDALRKYPTADAVVDITYDVKYIFNLHYIFTMRTDTVVGMAVRYNREQNNTCNRNACN